MRGTIAAAIAATMAMVIGAAAAQATTGAEMIGYLNAQRAANGIPAGITEDPALSDACAKHNAYGQQNGVLTHNEDPSKPGYTPEGAQAARDSVLYMGETWTASSNPFEFAPIHLSQTLQPRIDVMGAAETGKYGCATTFSSRKRPDPPADVVYTYPGDGTTIGYTDETASEAPYAPGEVLGLGKGARTGPYLLAFPDGPGLTPLAVARVTCAQLVGPDGPLDVISSDNSNSQLSGYLPTEVFMIPRQPLRAGTAYGAAVAAVVTPVGGAPRAFVKSWSFNTGAGAGAAPAASCPAPDPGAPPATTQNSKTAKGPSAPSRKLMLAFPTGGRGLMQITVGIEAAAVGHPAKLRTRVQRRRCSHKKCTWHQYGRSKTRQIKKLGASLKITLPRHPKGMRAEVRLSIPTFRGPDGQRYKTTTVVKTYR